MWVSIGSADIKNAYIWATPLKEIYVGATKVRPTGRTPGSNTILNYKFAGNLSDNSGNNRGASATWTVSYGTSPNYVTLSTSSYLTVSNMSNMNFSWTISMWLYPTGHSSSNSVLFSIWTNTTRKAFQLLYNGSNAIWFSIYGWGSAYTWDNVFPLKTRWNLVATYDYSTKRVRIYKNKSQSTTAVITWNNYSISNTTTRIGATTIGSATSTGYRYIGRIWEYIIENKIWNTTEIADYYELTKWDYGIS